MTPPPPLPPEWTLGPREQKGPRTPARGYVMCHTVTSCPIRQICEIGEIGEKRKKVNGFSKILQSPDRVIRHPLFFHGSFGSVILLGRLRGNRTKRSRNTLHFSLLNMSSTLIVLTLLVLTVARVALPQFGEKNYEKVARLSATFCRLIAQKRKRNASSSFFFSFFSCCLFGNRQSPDI